METSLSRALACGNVVNMHDLVDFVSQELERAGKVAAKYICGDLHTGNYVSIGNGLHINYTVPQKLGYRCGGRKAHNFYES